jgi:hypothetical protein
MASIEGVLNTEAHIHELFKHLHIRGEWYVYCQEIQDFMDNPQLPSFEETFTHLSYITENHKTKIEQLYQDGVSLNKIAKQTGFSSHQIRRYKEKYNLPLKYPAAPRSKNTGQAKHTKTPKTILVPKEVKIALI